MNSIDDYLLWFSMMIPMIFSPGPANLSIASLAGQSKLSQLIPYILGLLVGIVAWSALIGFGLGSLFVRFPKVFQVVEIIGALYILYLAITMYFSSSSNGKASIQPTFVKGITLQVLNAKLALALAAMFGQFLEVEKQVLSEIILLTVMNASLTMLAYMFWAYLGQWLKNNSESRLMEEVRSIVFSGALAAVGVYMMVHHHI